MGISRISQAEANALILHLRNAGGVKYWEKCIKCGMCEHGWETRCLWAPAMIIRLPSIGRRSQHRKNIISLKKEDSTSLWSIMLYSLSHDILLDEKFGIYNIFVNYLPSKLAVLYSPCRAALDGIVCTSPVTLSSKLAYLIMLYIFRRHAPARELKTA